MDGKIVDEYLQTLWEGMPDNKRDNELMFTGAISLAVRLGIIDKDKYELWNYRIKTCPEAPHVDGRIWCAYCGELETSDITEDTADDSE